MEEGWGITGTQKKAKVLQRAEPRRCMEELVVL